MKISRRGQRIYLYRSTWVPRSQANAHGYPVQVYVGALATDATVVPEELAEILDAEELEQLERTVCRPAREALQRAADLAMHKATDPHWRIAEAAQLLKDAVAHSAGLQLHVEQLRTAQMMLSRLLASQGVADALTISTSAEVDALDHALAAVLAATREVQLGLWGHAPTEGARATKPYRIWAEISAAVSGDEGSLMRALQEKGYIKRPSRGKGTA